MSGQIPVGKLIDVWKYYKQMNPYRKAVAFVLRLLATGFIIVPLILFGLDYMATKTRHAVSPSSPTLLATILKAGSLVLGLVLLVCSGAIARRLTEDLDE